MTTFDGEVALVTGAAGGIGAEICRAFRAAGARVALVDVNEGALASLAASLGNESQVAIFVANLADDAQAAALPERVHAHFGALDFLVNNAGIRNIASMLDLSIEDWRRTLDVDLTAPFVLSRAAIPLMMTQGRGKIVNISSMAGHAAFPNRPAYSAAKAGLLMLTRCTAVEFGHRGIWCNAILPGVVETPMTSVYFRDEAMAASIHENTPLGRWAQPDEIAAPVLFLCGRESDFINGTNLIVDGGWTAGYRAAQLAPTRR